jgi:ABC-type sugar transport system substrate-binding protein
MKLVKIFLPAIAVTAIVLGAIPALAAEPKVKIGVSLAMFDDVFITNVRDAMTKWAKAHPDVDLTIVDAANDTAKQTGQVENFQVQGKDAVVILPVDNHGNWTDDQGRRQSRQAPGVRQSPAREAAEGRCVRWFQVH